MSTAHVFERANKETCQTTFQRHQRKIVEKHKTITSIWALDVDDDENMTIPCQNSILFSQT